MVKTEQNYIQRMLSHYTDILSLYATNALKKRELHGTENMWSAFSLTPKIRLSTLGFFDASSDFDKQEMLNMINYMLETKIPNVKFFISEYRLEFVNLNNWKNTNDYKIIEVTKDNFEDLIKKYGLYYSDMGQGWWKVAIQEYNFNVDMGYLLLINRSTDTIVGVMSDYDKKNIPELLRV